MGESGLIADTFPYRTTYGSGINATAIIMRYVHHGRWRMVTSNRLDTHPKGWDHPPQCSNINPSFPILSMMLAKYPEIACTDTLQPDPFPHIDSDLMTLGRIKSSLSLSRKGLSQIARLILSPNLM